MFVVDVAETAYRFVFNNLVAFFWVSWPLIALLAVSETIASIGGTGAGVSLFALAVVVDIAFGLIWYRFFLLGSMNFSWWNGAGIQRAQEALKIHAQLIKKYAGWSIVLQIAVLPPMIIIFVILYAIFGDFEVGIIFIAAMLAQFAIVRYLPFFPAVAIGKIETRMNEAFDLSRGHTVKIWASILLATGPVNYLMLEMGGPYNEAAEALPRVFDLMLVAESTASAVLSLLSSALGASAIAEIYRRLSKYDTGTTTVS